MGEGFFSHYSYEFPEQDLSSFGERVDVTVRDESGESTNQRGVIVRADMYTGKPMLAKLANGMIVKQDEALNDFVWPTQGILYGQTAITAMRGWYGVGTKYYYDSKVVRDDDSSMFADKVIELANRKFVFGSEVFSFDLSNTLPENPFDIVDEFQFPTTRLRDRSIKSLISSRGN
jgi:hypothetical protein